MLAEGYARLGQADKALPKAAQNIEVTNER